MDAAAVIAEFAKRPVDAVRAFPELTGEQLNAHPGGHPNSIAWLLWHSGRQVDSQLAELTGEGQLWFRAGFRERFGLGPAGDHDGIGHSEQQARAIVVKDWTLLCDYLEAMLEAVVEYWRSLSEAELAEIIDVSYTPHVSRGVRLVSLIDDCQQHVGTANHIAGALLGTPAGIF